MYRKQFRNKIPRPGKCPFCLSKTMPDYRKAEDLRRFVSERGKIVSRGRSGVCAKHQRKLAQEIKRARHLGLLPFITRV